VVTAARGSEHTRGGVRAWWGGWSWGLSSSCGWWASKQSSGCVLLRPLSGVLAAALRKQ
jgi:hypothetical protein